MVPGTYGGGNVGNSEDPADGCLDISGGGTLENYEFAPVLMSCADSNEDGSLDFDIGISWYQNANSPCTFDNPDMDNPLPHPGTPAKCWHTSQGGGRIKLPSE